MVEILLEENEGLLEKASYFEEIEFNVLKMLRVAYVVKDTIYMW